MNPHFSTINKSRVLHKKRLSRAIPPALASAFGLFGLGLSPAVLSQAEPSEVAGIASEIDWVPYDELTPEQRNQVPAACCGLYLEPARETLDLTPGQILFRADKTSSTVDVDGNVQAIGEGNISIIQDDLVMQATSGQLDQATGETKLTGDIRVRQPGLLLVGSEASHNQQSGLSTLLQSSYVLHDQAVRGRAEIIMHTDADGIITIDNGTFTRCEPGDNSWQLKGEHIVLDRESGRGRARNSTVRVKGVPIFYSPWLSFPLNDERYSGFLMPSFGSSQQNGAELAVPFYLNLAPNYDATLIPRYYSDRGLMLGGEARHLGRSGMTNLLNFQYLPGDNKYDEQTAGDPESESPPVQDRWAINYDFSNRFSQEWSAAIDYASVSDIDYLRNFGTEGFYSRTVSYINRNGRLDYFGEHWNLNTRMTDFQVVDPNINIGSTPYSLLPQVDLSGYYNLDYGFNTGLQVQYTYFDRDLSPDDFTQGQIDNGVLATGSRISVEPMLQWTWQTPGIFLTPTVKYKYASYELEDQALGATDKPERGIFMGSLDTGLIFERDISFMGNAFQQTLEPRLFYLYSEYEDQSLIPNFDSSDMTFSFNQLFREDRFSGKDRVGDANQATLALSTRFYDAGGREKASASVGQILYFEDRLVSLNNLPPENSEQTRSAMAGEVSYRFSPDWNVYSYLEWNYDNNVIDVGTINFQYLGENNNLLNLGYRYRSENRPDTPGGTSRDIDQADISGAWQVADNWRIIARWNRDLANSRNLETLAGLEYNNCCYYVRLVAREWIDINDLQLDLDQAGVDRGVFFQFELKSLGSVLGGNISNLLTTSIKGYRDFYNAN